MSAEVIEGTGGFITAWLHEGAELRSGGVVPAGKVGVRLVGDIELVGDPADLAALGQRMAWRWQSPLIDALTDLAERLGAHAPGFTTFPQDLSCDTMDAFARLLALFGHADTAANLVTVHAEADEGEAHVHLREAFKLAEFAAKLVDLPVDYGPAEQAVADYVRSLLVEG